MAQKHRLAWEAAHCEFGRMNGGEQTGEAESSKTPPDRFGASYLAMDAAQRKDLPSAVVKRRRPTGRRKWIVFFVFVACVVLCFQREKLLPWLAENAITGPAYRAIVEKFRPPDNPERLPLTSLQDGSVETGGTTTFSSGQGFGSVSADDGSESFRVVTPPAKEANP